MGKYIPLDALLAEIEKIIADENESIKPFEHGKNISEVQRSNARIGVLMHLRSLLDTFDAKEVDLGKELKDWMQDNTDTAGFFDTEELAKHFFELGLKVNQDVDLELIVSWFDHITQIADDRKTANGVVMVDWAALDEIKCLAKESSEFIKTHYKAQKGE